jgi:hypothetical protein
MPRRPNFNYERQQRDRAKAAKRDAKREARAARKSGELPADGDDIEYDDGEPRPTVTLPAAAALEDSDSSTGEAPATDAPTNDD